MIINPLFQFGDSREIVMAAIDFDGVDSSTFLCDESKDLCFDDLEDSTPAEFSSGLDPIRGIIPLGSDSTINRVDLRSDESFFVMLAREVEYLPKEDYLLRLRNGELNLNFRREAFDWIWKAHAQYCFRPLSFWLAMNYLDRFLSLHDLPKDKAWAIQLLAVACLSIAVKMEETNVPQLIELQVADAKFVFEAKTIQRMEVLVLSTLNWQMNAITPFTFIDYFLNKITDGNPIPTNLINKSFQLILCTVRGLDLLEFKASEVAAAVAITVTGEIQTVNIDKALSSSSSINVQKGRVIKCCELIKDLSLMSRISELGSSLMPESPVTVLEAKCFSNRSDEISTTINPDNKRIRLDHTISRGNSSKS